MTSKAEALLEALVKARADVKDAETDVHRAKAELTAALQAIESDALASAYQTLRKGLHSGDTSAVADFNGRLREHFDAFVIDRDGPPVPIWKVEMPRALAAQITETIDDASISAYIERRVAQLGLVSDDPEHNRSGSQKPMTHNGDPADPEFLTVEDLAGRLKVKEKTVREWIGPAPSRPT